MKKLLYSLIAPAFGVLALACSSQKAQEPVRATALVSSPQKKELLANVNFKEVEDGVRVMAQVSGLEPKSVHGFHIHEFGKCEGDFKTAGGHLNPQSHVHSSPREMDKHLGDLGNLEADDRGVAKTELVIKGDDKEILSQIVGKSIIIHAKADDFKTQPSGNSGDRIACGVITTSSL